MSATAKVVDRGGSGPGHRGYLSPTLRALGVTLRHFVRNLFLGQRDIQTLSYPEEKRPYPPRFRGQHRLMLRDDGSLRCVACMLCPTICPAHCITVIAKESEHSDEKQARVFEIDELRCVVCGLCVEACPVDAIRMDTGIHVAPTRTRAAGVLGAFELRAKGSRSTTLDSPGVGVAWRQGWDQGPPSR